MLQFSLIIQEIYLKVKKDSMMKNFKVNVKNKI